ncbi:MAG: HNH endonuclease [Anaerolineae bacterium]|nr:HNH endonuclease [Anaerolineae bacterium]MDK1080985.1 HNH endonuclease [Anaerolineae bacterium]MDK1117350.1 HNH endonuclease [Anaerolineae bacterium]
MHEPVLVLNANFEPINVCTLRRAIGLLLTEKAAMVINGRGHIHTISQLFPRPSVIRLEYMIRRPRPRVKLTRREVFRRDNYTCQYCRQKNTALTVDHILPKHLGGKHVWINVVAACPSCNHRKGGRRLKEVHMTLLRKPKEPVANAMYMYGRHLTVFTEWEQFILGW